MKTLLTARVNHKPLSINAAYYRNKRKTVAYRAYEDAWALTLIEHKLKISPEDRLRIDYKWGFSNKAADVDNPIKTTQDVMQNWFEFNDKQVYIVKAVKTLVKKGEEFAEIVIQRMDE